MTSAELSRLYEDFHNDEIFARESLTVQTKEGVLVPMLFGPSQRKLAGVIADLRDRGKRVRVIADKARQVWVSNYVAARFWRDTVNQPGQNTLVLAHDHKAALKLFRYYERFDKYYKPFRGVIQLPKRISDCSDRLEYSNGSRIEIHTAGNIDIGRGGPLNRIHFSEFARYGSQARELMASAMGALVADGEAIVESTADGLGNEFHTMWERAGAGESEWLQYFFGWWEHPEYTLPLTTPAALFQSLLSPAERELRRQYSLTLEQMNWRRYTIANVVNGDEQLFRQEYPSSAAESFISSGRPRFNLAAIERMPIIHQALEGGLELVDIGNDKRLRFVPRERGELTIYSKPQAHREYMIGADSAQGIDASDGEGTADPDYAAAPVADRDTGEIVAVLHARLTSAEFARQLYMLGVYYNWAQTVPEINNHGWATVDALLREQYPPGLIYHRPTKTDQDPQERSDLIGFLTDQLTRPQMLSMLEEALRTEALINHSPRIQQECRTFVIKPNGKAEAQKRTHDDLVIGLGLIVIGIQQMPRKVAPKLLPKLYTEISNYAHRLTPAEEERRRRAARMERAA